MTKISNLYSLTNYITADSSGNIGIGTTSPTSPLTIGRVSSGSEGGQIDLCRSSDNANAWGIDVFGSTSTPSLRFVDNIASATRMAIDGTGKVGIGTTSPSWMLEVNKDTSSSGFGQYPAVSVNNPNASGYSAYYFFSGATNKGGFEYNNSTNNLLISGNGAERMRITSVGDVCVNTTTPSYSSTNRGTVTVAGASTALYALQIAGTARAYLYCDSINTYLDNSGGSGDVVVANGSGGVKLTRNATSWVSNSDIRLKNINSYIEDAVDKLLTLRTINFTWKSDDTNVENIGLVAQDVEKVFPQLIHKSKLVPKINEEQVDETEYLGVRYTELIPVLVKAIQELSAKVTALENK